MSFQTGNTVNLIWKKLQKGDYTVRPFEANKLWEITTNLQDRNYFGNSGIKVYRAYYPENDRYFGNVANLSSSLYQRVFTTQSIDPKMIWYQLDNAYYTNYNWDKQPVLLTDNKRKTYLAESSSVMIIPQDVFGEGIKKNSFTMANVNTASSLQYSVTDDGHGNLIDDTYDTNKFVDPDYLVMYIGFNEKYREYNFRNKQSPYVMDESEYNNSISVISPKNVSYVSGILTTDTSQSSGVGIALNGGYLEVDTYNNFNFKSTRDFAFSFWINTPATQSNEGNTYNSLFNKNTMASVNTLDHQARSMSSSKKQSISNKYPFDIVLTNRTHSTPYSIQFKQASDAMSTSVTSSALATGSWHHVVCQKTSSYYQIWIDGTLNSVVTASIVGNVLNDNYFFIGSNGIAPLAFSGSLDEIRVYGKGLTSQEISYLANNSFANGYAYQTNRVGNIFYKFGTAVISDPRPKYHNAWLGNTGNLDYNNLTYGFSGSFRSTTTFYEHEITCKIRKSEYNFTQNPSVYLDKDPNARSVENYVTSSFFNPYITTIGLYSDDYELLAVAKLSSATEKRDDTDMNFIIRFDC
jgi:hypothetical protein